jgi:hypothetical protein
MGNHMDSNEQEYIQTVATKYGVAPYQLMDILKIRYSRDKYQVNDKLFLSYCDAIREAESSFETVQRGAALSQACRAPNYHRIFSQSSGHRILKIYDRFARFSS